MLLTLHIATSPLLSSVELASKLNPSDLSQYFDMIYKSGKLFLPDAGAGMIQRHDSSGSFVEIVEVAHRPFVTMVTNDY
jgi:hypothetical protein